MKTLKKITIIGGGVLGSQIAFQSAFHGFTVSVYTHSADSLEDTATKLNHLQKTYQKAIKLMVSSKNCDPKDWCLGIADYGDPDVASYAKKAQQARQQIKLELDLAAAVKGSDLVIEAIPEDLKLKKAFFTKLSKLLDPKTIIATNSSTLLPSKMAKSTGRPDRFLALHFANSIWKNNTAEVMAQPATSKNTFDTVLRFARDIKMLALPLHKEKAGYLLNSMLVPLLFAALDLYVTGVSDIKSIDAAWKRGTATPHGPFEILDVVGIETAHNIVKTYAKVPSFLAPYHFKDIEKMLAQMLAEGKSGKACGQGFYKY